MPYAFRHQPLKGLYLVYQLITTLFVRFPLWVLFSIPRSLRGRKSWTFKRALWVRFLRHFMNLSNHTGPIIRLPDHRAITPGPGVSGVWVGTANHLVTGDLKLWAKIANVSSIRVPGYWIHKTGTSIKVASGPQPGEKVIYQFHGGGYTRLSAHPNDVTSQIVKGYLKHLDIVSRVFSLEYRLASTKPFQVAHPFPTQLLDALAGYNYLVNVVGFAPENIIISGDSAGGNLAHALTRYLTEYQESAEVNLPAPPGALILLSPWVDLGTTANTPNSSAKTYHNSDYLGLGEGLSFATQAFCGPHGLGAANTNPYISPASLDSGLIVDFKKFPRTFVVAGGAEVLYDSIKILRDHMIKDLGEGDGVQPNDGKVRYVEALDGVHDYLVFPWHEPERTDTYKAINKWLAATS
ncbi:Alpha/Beta hydrolase protein [Gymnopilus junonius]|uniref:Alpha/Beta hydrolase protein n=1 Tax=Gymnopilus junonius TaxID=109634 RepID=A0A9P5NL13_GYMJU|nr:Alpha/Beta hydrolase protein [Gymnopilus junonius]